MSYLSVCSCVKDEAAYLDEWIHFHQLQGVERFFIYDNDSTDGTRDVLEPYIRSGLVFYKEWPGRYRQLEAMADFLNGPGRRGVTEWCAMIDVDEFLFTPPSASATRPSSLAAQLMSYHKFAGVAVNWAAFGTSGHEEKPPGLVIENFTRRTEDVGINRHVKSIIRPALIYPRRPDDVHHYRPIDGLYVVNEKRMPVTGPFSEPVSWGRFRINHYWSRSVAEARVKVERGRADVEQKRDLADVIAPHYNDVEDLLIQPYVGQVLSRLCAFHDHELVGSSCPCGENHL